jgi:uncharacterized cofD-like protein
MQKALANTKARVVYVCNLVTKPGQTDNFKVHDFANEIERFVGAKVLDFVLYNTEHPEQELLEKYSRDKEFGVEIDKNELDAKPYRTKGTSLISKKLPKKVAGDKISANRAFIRHDSDVVARQIMKIYFS